MTTILVTGTGRGIGLELAKQALAKGWTVYGSAREPVTEPEAHICAHPAFHDLVFDVTDDAAVRAAAAAIAAPIDIVINNAGIIGDLAPAPSETDLDVFARTVAVNTIAPLRIAQAFLPHLKRSSRPRLLTLSSFMGTMSNTKANNIAYRASKAAANKVMQGLGVEFAQLGIAVATLHPGWVRTDMGGQGADVAPEESAAGILKIADELTIATTGRFLNYDGTVLDW
jgi:Short-chain dehydrogenases of various substrate specificities